MLHSTHPGRTTWVLKAGQWRTKCEIMTRIVHNLPIRDEEAQRAALMDSILVERAGSRCRDRATTRSTNYSARKRELGIDAARHRRRRTLTTTDTVLDAASEIVPESSKAQWIAVLEAAYEQRPFGARQYTALLS